MKSGRGKEQQLYDYQFNFVIVGESGVGKSCIVLNFAEQKPRRQHQVTIACEFASRIMPVSKRDVKIQIWDTAGQENFRSITRSYYRSSVAAIVVYDITNKRSFDKVASWLEELRDNAHNKICVFLVGNKNDLELQRQVSYEEGVTLAKTHKIKFTETCAFELNTIDPLFKSLAEDVMAKIDSKEIDPKNEQFGVKIGNSKKLKIEPSTNSGGQSSKLDSVSNEETTKKKCCGGGN
jgi:Ras-related protein Rab-2A